MEIVKILGIGLISVILIIIIKQYKPEFSVYISLIAGVIIILLVIDKITRSSGTAHCIIKQSEY